MYRKVVYARILNIYKTDTTTGMCHLNVFLLSFHVIAANRLGTRLNLPV
jgi:hypothetical protein